ncbi:hypothetical protein WKG02_13985 [Xanthomonas oryzae pv. oryzae]
MPIRFCPVYELRCLLAREFARVGKRTGRPTIFVYAVALRIVHVPLHGGFCSDPWCCNHTGLDGDALLSASSVDPDASAAPSMVRGRAGNAPGPCRPLGSAFDTADDFIDLGVVTRLAALGQANAQRLVGAACTLTALPSALVWPC